MILQHTRPQPSEVRDDFYDVLPTREGNELQTYIDEKPLKNGRIKNYPKTASLCRAVGGFKGDGRSISRTEITLRHSRGLVKKLK